MSGGYAYGARPQPVHDASSRSEQAYLLLKSAILALRLKPGEPLVETRLARQLHISTTPLREALARLKHEGFVVGLCAVIV